MVSGHGESFVTLSSGGTGKQSGEVTYLVEFSLRPIILFPGLRLHT
jgi:hypothetical protein